MWKNLQKREGFTLIELMIVVAIIAILAVVAVPQFTKYMRTAKTAEANEMLDLIKKGAASYYTTPRVEKGTGLKVACQYPGAVGVTPVGASCCDGSVDADDDERCDSEPGRWNHATWSALKFAITDQHYFQFQFNSSGILADSVYTADAFGDLDCDGTMSTFQLVGVGDPNATKAECDAVGVPAMYRENETE